MRTVLDVLKVLFVMWAIAVALALLGGAMVWAGYAPGLPLMLFVVLGIGWMIYAYLQYRQARQDELLQVLATAVESDLPVGPAIRAYLVDRPHEGVGGAWDILLMVLLFPAFWLWMQRHRFDRKAALLADLLDEGYPLADALRIVRGVAAPEVRVAVAVGEATGRLSECLRRVDRYRLAGAWLEIIPRVLYPLLLLIFITGVLGYMVTNILPKMRMIFADFNMPLPAVTDGLFKFWDQVSEYSDWIGLAIPALVLFTAVLIASPDARWYTPLLGRLYRWEVQGLVLRMLGTLFAVGQPAPAALRLLAGSPDFPDVARRRLKSARTAVERGESLPAALRNARLLPANMAPLVQTAERCQTLPWALGELGELLTGRAVRVAQRVSQVLCPVLVIAIGVVIGLVVVGMFFPLIAILTKLASE